MVKRGIIKWVDWILNAIKILVTWTIVVMRLLDSAQENVDAYSVSWLQFLFAAEGGQNDIEETVDNPEVIDNGR